MNRKYKSVKQRIPEKVYERVGKLSKLLDVPTTKAFIIQERFLFGDFKVKKICKKGNKKEVFEIEFD